jgi:hypothetical protein
MSPPSVSAPRDRGDHKRRDEKSIDPVEGSIETILRLENMELRRRNWSDVLADTIAGFTGSIAFVILHLLWLSLWAAWNSRIITFATPFDPYPFHLLAMIVSLDGVLLVTFVPTGTANFLRHSHSTTLLSERAKSTSHRPTIICCWTRDVSN